MTFGDAYTYAFCIRDYALAPGHGNSLTNLKYSRTPLFRSPKGNEKKFEIAGLRNNRGSVKGKGKSEGIRSSFEIAGTSN